MPIRVTCQCGKGFHAPDSLAGKAVKCPACGSALPIPKPGDSDIFTDLGDLADLEAAASQASSSGVGGALSTGMTGSGRGGTSLQMGSGGRTSSPPISAIIAGVVIALTCVILIIVLVTRGPGSGSRRGIGNGEPSERSPEDRGSGAEADAGGDVPPATGSGSRDDGGEQASGGGLGGVLSRMIDAGKSPPPGETDDGGAGTDTDASASGGARAKYMQPTLQTGILNWYKQDKLIASRPVGDIPMRELHYGWMVELLPHLGYQEDYDKLEFDKPWLEKPNLEVAKKVIPEFLNPADDRKAYVGFRFDELGLTHFVGMSGVEDGRNVTAATLPRSDARAGIFGYTEIARREEITDGTSKTIMLIGSGKLAGPWIASGGSTVRGARPAGDGSYFHEMYGLGSLGYDKKGAIALMADGSIRWIGADIDGQVFRAFCTIHGNDEVDMSALRAGFDLRPVGGDGFRGTGERILPIGPPAPGVSYARPAWRGSAGMRFLPKGGDGE